MLRTYTAVLHDGRGVPEGAPPTRQPPRGRSSLIPLALQGPRRRFGLLGYGYLLLILSFSVGLPVLFILGLFTSATAVFIQLVLKLGIPLFALAAVLVRSLWVRIPAPVGIPLRKEQAPALFETALRLSRDVRAPQVHEVILDGSFNASVVQIPRLGVLGWSRNYLTVGLPLLDALTPEQFESVLAPSSATSPARTVASRRGSTGFARLDAAGREPQEARTAQLVHLREVLQLVWAPLRGLHARAGALAGILR